MRGVFPYPAGEGTTPWMFSFCFIMIVSYRLFLKQIGEAPLAVGERFWGIFLLSWIIWIMARYLIMGDDLDGVEAHGEGVPMRTEAGREGKGDA